MVQRSRPQRLGASRLVALPAAPGAVVDAQLHQRLPHLLHLRFPLVLRHQLLEAPCLHPKFTDQKLILVATRMGTETDAGIARVDNLPAHSSYAIYRMKELKNFAICSSRLLEAFFSSDCKKIGVKLRVFATKCIFCRGIKNDDAGGDICAIA